MDFNQARYNMVEQQIRPWEIFDLNLLSILHEIPREEFVEQEFKDLAYADINLPIQNGSMILEPKIIARLIQDLELTKEKQVLEVGTGSGYATAILAKSVKAVDTYDVDKIQLNKAKSTLDKLNILNINYFNKDILNDMQKNEMVTSKKYDAIYIGAAIHFIPDFLKKILKTQGKIVAIVGKPPILEATVITKIERNKYSIKKIFETNIPYLQEKYYQHKNDFEF